MNNNNNDDDDDNNNDNEDDDEADAAVDEQRLPTLRLVDLQQLRNWFQTIQCPANTMVYFSINIFVRCCLIESQSSRVPPTFASHSAAR